MDLKSLVFTLALFGIVSCSTASTVVVSDHFDGRRFRNKEPGHTLTDTVKWLWQMETVEWPDWIVDAPQPAPPGRTENDRLRVTFINHATVLIQMDGLNVLTDPIWSTCASPVGWLGPKRVRAPGVRMEDLPRIDVVLISHDHYDHLDLPTLRILAERDKPLVLTGLRVGSFLASEPFRGIHELDWWQSYRDQATGVSFTFVPALHQSGRLPFFTNRTLWGGFVLEGATGRRIYFAGDTGYGSFLDEIRKRFPGFQLTILPVGSYEKRWFMKNQHMNPDDAVRAHLLLNSSQSMGIHYGTFKEHPEQSIDSHEKDLAHALHGHGLSPEQFWLMKFGEGREVGCE
jgi:L-ascorbate metabolism protein UlaG (beta-lactamase superfamily)